MDNITYFSLMLGILSIILGFCSLVFSIIYLIKITKLEIRQNILDKDRKSIDDIISILIAKSTMFSDSSSMSGQEIVNILKAKHKCNDLEALKIMYNIDSKSNQ